MTATLDWIEFAAREFEEHPSGRADYPTAGELAAAIDPTTVQTPALDLIDDALVDVAEGDCDRLIISMPPQEGKSSRVTTVGPLWFLLRDPDMRIAVVSYGKELAEDFGRAIRGHITSNSGEDDTLDLGLRIAPDNGAAGRWRLDGHRGGVRAVGISGGLTGRPADLLIIDDPISNREQADSRVFRERIWKWWTDVGNARLGANAPVILILTRWHEDDLAGRLLAAEDGHRWRVINIPAQADHDPTKGETDPLGREPGEFLRSARGRDATEWQKIRIAAGSRTWGALYQGKPTPSEGGILKRGWWRYYDRPVYVQHPDGTCHLPNADEVALSWDATFKDVKTADYVVGQVWGRRGADVYLLDQVRARMDVVATIAAITALAAKWPQATGKLIEDKANGPAIISLLHSKVPGLIAVQPDGSKEARASAVSPFVEAGNVHIPAPSISPWVGDFVEECAGFPLGAHDDQVDAMSQALARLLLDGTGANAWLAWAKRKAEEATGHVAPATPAVAGESPKPAGQPTLTAAGLVTPTDHPDTWLVRFSDGRRDYAVTPDGACTCQAGAHGRPCRHVTAAQLASQGAGTAIPPAVVEQIDPVAARKRARDAAFRAMR